MIKNYNLQQNKDRDEGKKSFKSMHVTLYGMTEKRSEEANSNHCSIQFTEASVIEQTLAAAMFLDTAINLTENSREYFDQFGKNLDLIPVSDQKNVEISINILKSKVEKLTDLLEETRYMRENIAQD